MVKKEMDEKNGCNSKLQLAIFFLKKDYISLHSLFHIFSCRT